MQWSLTFGAWLLAGLAAGVAAAPAAAQPPTAAGVVVVRAADAAGTADEGPGEVVGLGFVAGDGQVVAAVDAARTRYVVLDAGGTEHEALLAAADEASGLGLLVAPGLTAAPYAFARDPVEVADEVHAAALDAGGVRASLVQGRVLAVAPGSGAPVRASSDTTRSTSGAPTPAPRCSTTAARSPAPSSAPPARTPPRPAAGSRRRGRGWSGASRRPAKRKRAPAGVPSASHGSVT